MSTRDVLSFLEGVNPVTAGDVGSWPRSERGQEVLERVLAAPRHEPGLARHRRGRIVLAAAAVVAAGVAGVVVLPLTRAPDGASAPAASVLLAAARVAEDRPTRPVPHGSFRYTKSEDATRVFYDACSVPQPDRGPLTCPLPPPDDWEFSVLVPHTREVWIGRDGSGRLRVETGEPLFLGPEDRAEWIAAGRPALDDPGVSDERFGPEELLQVDFSEYSTDPGELYDQIRGKAEGYGPSTDAEMFVLVGDLLREAGRRDTAPPELRAALFRVAARIGGVELVGEVTDPAGRQGVAVARTSDDHGFLHRVELVFDPETSQLLAERTVLLQRVGWIDAEPGTAIGYSVYDLESGVVESPRDRP